MPVTGFDHVSFPAGDPEAIIAFYKRLGFTTIHEEEWRLGDYPLFAIAIGSDAKLNFPSMGRKSVNVKSPPGFGRAISINPPRGQMCRAFFSS